jgi:hypothetical protein
MTAVWASRGSKNFLIFLPAKQPAVFNSGSNLSQRLV